MMMPLIQDFQADDIFARRDGETITAGRFMSDVAALAEILPAASACANLCQDRYRFAVGLGAALLRGFPTLLPPNATPGTMARLAELSPDAVVLADCEYEEAALPVFQYPGHLEALSTGHIPSFEAGQVAAILFTSGSTGTPQPHARSWGSMVESARSAGRALLGDHLKHAGIVATVPHQHSYGIESSVMLGLQNGLVLECGRPLLPGDIAARLEASPRPRILVTAPIHLKALLADDEPLPPADLLLSATAPLNPQLSAKAEARFAAPLHEIYGCSEAGQLATRRTAETETWDCLHGVTLVQDNGSVHAEGAPVASPHPLNDVIELLSPTRFRLHGRTADLLNIAGKRSSLAHLDYQLTAIPGVVDGTFLMQPGRERLMAFAVAPGLTQQDILDALRRQVDPAFLPRPLVLVDTLPRNALGKLTRETLLELAKAHGKVYEIAFPADHPTAAGHFPGDPVIPGAVLLDRVMTVLGIDPPCTLRDAKFLRPVRPGDRLTVTCRHVEGGMKFEGSLDGTIAVTGTLAA
jgi:acyl-CoA synthetase (AMP-forming)/AMP-acid ligase II